MRWAAAIIIETKEEFILRAAYIEADNRYEAMDKAHTVGNKLWPKKLRLHVRVCEADEKHLINNPEHAQVENACAPLKEVK
jgi:hypothetical protein